MRAKRIQLGVLWCLWLAASWGCTIAPLTSGTSDLSSGPYLIAEPVERHRLQELRTQHERMIQTCPKSPECERALYTHAVIALFENGATAASEMKAVVAQAPSGPFAAASARWLQVLEMGMPSSSREQALRAYLSQQVLRELVGTEAGPVQRVAPHVALFSSVAAPSVALQQRVKDQERRIAELTTQLHMLKRLDHGRMKER